jgi:hypothetical protein
MNRLARCGFLAIASFCTAAIILFPLTGSGARAQDKPSWAADLPNIPQRAGYYQGLGITKATADGAADWNDASGKARAQISSQIRVRISNTVSRAVQETSSGTDNTIAEAYASTTDQITTASLEGIVLERWFDEDAGTLYAYGAISQAEVERRFREKMEDALASARVYNAGAAKALERNDPFTALGQLSEAILVVALAEGALDRTLSASLDGKGEAVPVMPALQTQLCGMLSRMQFEVLEGNGQEAERGKGLAAPLRGRVSFRSDHGTYPLKNADLVPSFVAPATGRVPEDIRTDAAGEFTLPVIEVKNGEAVNRVRVSPGVPGAAVLKAKSPDLARCWSTAYLDFTFKMKSRTNITLALRILESNMGAVRAKSSVQEEVQRGLLGSQYSILDESKALGGMTPEQIHAALTSGDYGPIMAAIGKHADIAIVGEATTAERSNPFPQMYFGVGRVVLRILDCKTGRVLGSVLMEDQKEGGPTYDQAGRKLLEKMGRSASEQVRQEIKSALE